MTHLAWFTWFGLSALVLGIVLFFPVRKLILAINVNRQQRKLQRALSPDELEILNRKVSAVAAAVAVTFAFIYTRFLMARFLGPPP